VIIRETGARRVAIVRKSLRHNNGLRWKHIDWMRNQVLLEAKGKHKFSFSL